ncbi:ABC transporter permease subunit [Nonomuraea jiangxiensis]|uniref:ABC-2 type transport system permease protein n=1 Tax=Nonomuraea jiangxiensis TaxID=633440 RepID=A0A1G9A9F8_9ACTN|nr:ABC transporter permease subunit [Nonomuraea jiangxiensis]SDK24002.1 ABC-2 type transport system permease protein [Nonomuraea jiangxiensis]
MRRELHAEWTKLRTEPGAGRLLLGLVTLTAVTGVALTAGVTCPWDRCTQDTVKLGLTGVQLGQAFAVMLAVRMISGEYGTGLIRLTLAAMPRRTTVLAAKATLLTGLTLAGGAVAVAASLLGAGLLLPARGYPPPSPADGPTLRAALGSVLYLALIALISLGLATVLREPAAAAGTVLGLLYLFPLAVLLLPDPDWQRLLWRLSPMNAGLAVQATTGLDDLPLDPWTGLAVPAAWAAAALLAGGLALRRRDA